MSTKYKTWREHFMCLLIKSKHQKYRSQKHFTHYIKIFKSDVFNVVYNRNSNINFKSSINTQKSIQFL